MQDYHHRPSHLPMLMILSILVFVGLMKISDIGVDQFIIF